MISGATEHARVIAKTDREVLVAPATDPCHPCAYAGAALLGKDHVCTSGGISRRSHLVTVHSALTASWTSVCAGKGEVAGGWAPWRKAAVEQIVDFPFPTVAGKT